MFLPPLSFKEELPKIIINQTGKIIFANKEFEKLSGYCKQDIEYQFSWQVFFQSEDIVKIQNFLTSPKKTYFEHKINFIDRNANLRQMHLSICPLDKNWVISFIDIESVEKVSIENQVYKVAFDILKIALAITDKHWRIKWANSVFQHFIKLSPDELINTNILGLLFNKKNKKECENINITLTQGQKWQGFIPLDSQDEKGHKKTLNAYLIASPINLEHNNESFYVFVISDKSSELELQQRLEKMASLGSFAAEISHDFNNLLSPILAYSEILLKKVPQNTFVYEKLKIINETAFWAKDLIGQILALSRFKEATPVPLRLDHATKKIFEFLRRFISQKIKMKLEINSKGFVKADPLQIYQILLNLCINAAEAMGNEGEITIKIEDVEIRQEDFKKNSELKPGKYVKVSVIDTGPGIDRNIPHRIFEPYFTTKKGGIGLGLTVAHRIVKELGGQIGCQNILGKGANFYFFLPRIDNKK